MLSWENIYVINPHGCKTADRKVGCNCSVEIILKSEPAILQIKPIMWISKNTATLIMTNCVIIAFAPNAFFILVIVSTEKTFFTPDKKYNQAEQHTAKVSEVSNATECSAYSEK